MSFVLKLIISYVICPKVNYKLCHFVLKLIISYVICKKLDNGLPPKGVLSMKTLMHPTAATPQGVLTSLAHSA